LEFVFRANSIKPNLAILLDINTIDLVIHTIQKTETRKENLGFKLVNPLLDYSVRSIDVLGRIHVMEIDIERHYPLQTEVEFWKAKSFAEALIPH
jgi:hypothetical protein